MWLLELHKDLPDNPVVAMVSIREEGAVDGWFDGGGVCYAEGSPLLGFMTSRSYLVHWHKM